ncbi:MAG: hypothetical protein ABJD07_10495, partial [Gemmatimonadaceae bacterium]
RRHLASLPNRLEGNHRAATAPARLRLALARYSVPTVPLSPDAERWHAENPILVTRVLRRGHRPRECPCRAKPARNMQLVAQRDSLEKALEAIAIIDREEMMLIFVRTTYTMNYWDVRLGAR